MSEELLSREREIRRAIHQRYKNAMMKISLLQNRVSRADACIEGLRKQLAEQRDLVEMAERICMNRSWLWLESTRKLQEEAFGVDYSQLSGDKLADYVLMNAYAIVDELAEAMAEIQWKPWATSRGFYVKDAMAGELVDLAHFLANIATAIGVTDEEWQAIYQEKQARNQKRQASGYEAADDKCPGCRRELDKRGMIHAHRPALSNAPFSFSCVYCSQLLGIQTEEGIRWEPGFKAKNPAVPPYPELW